MYLLTVLHEPVAVIQCCNAAHCMISAKINSVIDLRRCLRVNSAVKNKTKILFLLFLVHCVHKLLDVDVYSKQIVTCCTRRHPIIYKFDTIL